MFGYDSKERLKGHGIIDINEQPYQCDFCGYECNAKDDMIIHIKGHYS